jgi:NDP-sugar pyrophosphorylase family protein
MNLTLLVLAAGMGSRYGGLKQIDPLGPAGETILDYSVFDAMRAGFGRVVFVIRRDFEADFRESVGRRFEGRVDVDYVFQQANDLPEGFVAPADREKPWGTGHAIWCARSAVDSPFLAINADDFYGSGAFPAVADFLRSEKNPARFCMAGYRLDTTLSENGTVSRGVCETTPAGLLRAVREHTRISRGPSGIADEADGTVFTGAERVSMNCWGFTPEVFTFLGEGLRRFLENHAGDPKSEFYIPSAVAEMVEREEAEVSVLPVESRWFGMTYREDRPAVVEALRALVASGAYPSPLA